MTRELDRKYGQWNEILRAILNGKLILVPNLKSTDSDTDDDDEDDGDEEMPEATGRKTYDTYRSKQIRKTTQYRYIPMAKYRVRNLNRNIG